MNEGATHRIAIVGTGNLASNLIHAFKNSSVKVEQVLSRSIENAKILAAFCNAEAIDNPRHLKRDLDLVILAIKDDALDDIYLKLFSSHTPLVHCSGSVDTAVLKKFDTYGVFYPLQTFSQQKIVDFSALTIFIESNKTSFTHLLEQIARTISNECVYANSDERKKLHIAAVFACNFSNSMYQIAEELCIKNGMKFEYLHPLILETAHKATLQSPKTAQTGPAIRGDIRIIKAHLTTLNFNKSIKHIYSSITNRISSLRIQE